MTGYPVTFSLHSVTGYRFLRVTGYPVTSSLHHVTVHCFLCVTGYPVTSSLPWVAYPCPRDWVIPWLLALRVIGPGSIRPGMITSLYSVIFCHFAA